MNKKQARRIALGYLASIAVQDEERILESAAVCEFSEADEKRLTEALAALSDELFVKAGLTRNGFVEVSEIATEVLRD